MKKTAKFRRTTINANESVEGETLETQIERMLENKEPVIGQAPLIYSERKDGVLAGYNIRTDRFEVAVEATTIINKSEIAKRESRHKEPEKEVKVIEMDTEGKSTGDTK